MKKKIIMLVLALAMLLSACGDVSRVDRVIGESEIYTEKEIERAMQMVTSYFMVEFSGCTLTELRYDEEKTAEAAREWAGQYEADEAIVILSNFDVDESGGDGSLMPNSTYENYQWILVMSTFGWELKDWGYG